MTPPRKLALKSFFGDYVRPGDDIIAAQQAVIEAIEEHAPEMIADLATRADVAEWARRWGLDTPWMRFQAEETRELWREYPHILTDKTKYPRPSWLVTGPESGDLVGLDDDTGVSWNPRMEPEAVFRARVETYIAKRHAEASAEFVKAPRRDREHFEWFVRHHVLQQSYAEITDGDHRRVDAVAKAVKRVAALVGISLARRDKTPTV